VWVDKVAPTVTMLQSGKRLCPPRPSVAFSEAMTGERAAQRVHAVARRRPRPRGATSGPTARARS
jgi:hypothetical protein